jgi:hypothetical protein
LQECSHVLYTDMGERGDSLVGEFGGGSPPQNILGGFLPLFLAVFQCIVFVNGFLIPVKELGLLNNMGQ